MLLNDLQYFEQRASIKTQYYGLDDPTRYSNMRPDGWFEKYPIQDFDYQFNSWGFRGPEYNKYVKTPVNICLGDSFTVNLGAPIEHSWSTQLHHEYLRKFNIPTINLGIDGAGNDAIRLVYDRAIKLFDVQKTFVMYSYFHRRLVNNEFTHYTGEKKNLEKKWEPTPLHTDEENFDYFEQYFIEEAYSTFLPHWCYTNKELEYIGFYQHYQYPAGEKSKWANRDYHHMNQELNGLVAEYFYGLFLRSV